jgi:hypothetical protein
MHNPTGAWLPSSRRAASWQIPARKQRATMLSFMVLTGRQLRLVDALLRTGPGSSPQPKDS